MLVVDNEAFDAEPKVADNRPAAPAVPPGRGLAVHDFFCAGEAKVEHMFMVWRGGIRLVLHHPGKGEISDAILLPSGNILFAHQP